MLKFVLQIKPGVLSGGFNMNKEEILERSRKENKNQDIYEKEVIIQGNRYACIAAGAVLWSVGNLIPNQKRESKNRK